MPAKLVSARSVVSDGGKAVQSLPPLKLRERWSSLGKRWAIVSKAGDPVLQRRGSPVLGHCLIYDPNSMLDDLPKRRGLRCELVDRVGVLEREGSRGRMSDHAMERGLLWMEQTMPYSLCERRAVA